MGGCMEGMKGFIESGGNACEPFCALPGLFHDVRLIPCDEPGAGVGLAGLGSLDEIHEAGHGLGGSDGACMRAWGIRMIHEVTPGRAR
jgi:hypothetical protein